MNKYEFTNQTKEFNGVLLRQIRALRAIPAHNIKPGHFGGWIDDDSSLSQEGNCWIMPNVMVIESTILGDTLVKRGVIEECTLQAEIIDCVTIKRSVINCARLSTFGSTAIENTTIESDEMISVFDSTMTECKISEALVNISDASEVSNVTMTGNNMSIRKSTVRDTNLDGKSIFILDSHVSNGSHIKGTEIRILESELFGFRIKGEHITLNKSKMVTGRMIAEVFDSEGDVDVYNTHVQGENIGWKGSIKIHNCSFHTKNLKFTGFVDVDWVYFKGDDIELTDNIVLRGKEMDTTFQVKTKAKLNGMITMKRDVLPISIEEETVEGIFDFIS